eukprot:gene19918-21869_t
MADEMEHPLPEDLLAAMENLKGTLKDCDKLLKKLTEVPLQDSKSKLEPLQKAKLDLTATYAINSLFWIYLVTQGVNATDHPVKDELERIKKYMMKIKSTEEKIKGADAKLDKEAAKRLLTSALWTPKDKRAESGSIGADKSMENISEKSTFTKSTKKQKRKMELENEACSTSTTCEAKAEKIFATMSGGGVRRSFGNTGQNNSGQQRRYQQQPYLVDRKLLPRVKEYLGTLEQEFSPDVDDILSYLQMTFPEYGRKKRNALKQSVMKILSMSSTHQGKSPSSKSSRMSPQTQKPTMKQRSYSSQKGDVDSFSSDEQEELIEARDTNLINNSMHQMYSKVSRGSFSTPIYVDSPPPSDFNASNDIDTATTEPLKGNSLLAMSQTAVDVPSILGQTSNEIPTPILSTNKKLKLQDASTPVVSPVGNKNDDDNRIKRNQMKRKRKDADENSSSVKKQTFQPTVSNTKLANVGGYENSLEEVIKLLFHLKHPEVFKRLGVKPPCGFLLHGPPGCGKTLLANAIAGELQLPYFKLAATEIISGVSGESEEKLRELFSFAQASAASPSIIFLDEIDAIAPRRETASKEMERRIVSQLLVCMDDLTNGDADVLIIGATNRPDSLDPALRRAGRFDREICLGIPDLKTRIKILDVLCNGLRLSESCDFSEIASLTPGFVAADLVSLTREAAMFAVQRIFNQMEERTKFALSAISIEGNDDSISSENKAEDNESKRLEPKLGALSWLRDQPPLPAEELDAFYIEIQDFKNALSTVQPSAKREGFATVPDVSWEDIGALEDIREELSLAILAPVRHSEQFASLGIANPPGILLAGPPGCGKTLLAKAIANEAGINFISVKGPELLNMYVGESEKAVRQVFQRARNSSPCVIFFDEIDALCPKRSGSAESNVSARVVNQLLTEMDGLETRKQVFLMGATNRPDIIDSAVLRPGRLDKILFVDLPSPSDRVKILQTITKFGTKPPLSADVQLDCVANDARCERFSGADLAALIREASVQSLKEFMKKQDKNESNEKQSIMVSLQHFEIALGKIRPSVTIEDRKWYDKLMKRFTADVF